MASTPPADTEPQLMLVYRPVPGAEDAALRRLFAMRTVPDDGGAVAPTITPAAAWRAPPLCAVARARVAPSD